MTTCASELSRWASELEPTTEDLALAERSLLDTVAVILAAVEHPIRALLDEVPEAARWTTLGHVLDFDDLHMTSTAHISVVTVPAVLAVGGDARAYLAGAGVMARLGMVLGWTHYRAGWHATCTSGAPAAAVAAGVALGLDQTQLMHAMALATPAAGGVQRAFGTDAKSLQVGFAAQAGVRAAQLVSRGATADPATLDSWLTLLGGDPARLDLTGPAVPGGLAIKQFPCCYAMQRPIAAIRSVRQQIKPDQVSQVTVTTPHSTLQPLIHDRPSTGLQAKFSMKYAVAVALLDAYPGFASFTDERVQRPDVQHLLDRISVQGQGGHGSGLLDGKVEIQVLLRNGDVVHTALDSPPGSPEHPLSVAALSEKAYDCVGVDGFGDLSWTSARQLLRDQLAVGGNPS